MEPALWEVELAVEALPVAVDDPVVFDDPELPDLSVELEDPAELIEELPELKPWLVVVAEEDAAVLELEEADDVIEMVTPFARQVEE